MAGRIKDEDVQYIRDHAPIDEVVGEYVQLKSAGGGQKKVSALSMMKSRLHFTSHLARVTSTALVVRPVAMSLPS